MNKNKFYKSLSALLLVGVAVFFLCYYEQAAPMQYFSHRGNIFGTYYNIQYQSTKGYERELLKELNKVDGSLSAFNTKSTISLINSNKSDNTDPYFETVFAQAQSISALTEGSFDITVAPLVNLWGFGFSNSSNVTNNMVDSIKQFVGYPTVDIVNHHLVKSDSRTMLDASAIAKGFGCDVAAAVLKQKGCTNLLVDIGGEVVAEGVNSSGKNWRVGISTPADDPNGENHELAQIVSATQLDMATSVNYRRFYYDNGVRRSHTIDPHTGYPVSHNLLSATVLAPTCTQADALATACMVLGVDKAIQLIETLDNTEAYLISADSTDYVIHQTSGMSLYIQNNN